MLSLKSVKGIKFKSFLSVDGLAEAADMKVNILLF